MYDFNYADVKSVNHHSSLPLLKVKWNISKIVLALMISSPRESKLKWQITKIISALMISSPKEGKVEWQITFLEGQNRNHRLYFYFYKNGFNSPTATGTIPSLIVYTKQFFGIIKIENAYVDYLKEPCNKYTDLPAEGLPHVNQIP